MRLLTGKRILTVVFFLGVLTGVLLTNLITRSYIVENGIFNAFFLTDLRNVKIDGINYFLYLLKVRLAPLGVMLVAAMAGWRRAASVGCVGWFGMQTGVFLTAAVMQMGGKGLLLGMLMMVPQMPFYLLGYLVLLWTFYGAPSVSWSLPKVLFTVGTFCVGFLLEIYVNPMLLKACLGHLKL